jgi:hypothetical protein
MGMLSLLLMGSSSCKKSIPAGKPTRVRGIVYDNIRQQPIPNVRIEIVEYERGFARPLPVGVIDSARTGNDGKYDLTFTTTGNGIAYKAGFTAPADYYTIDGQKELLIGGNNVANFWAIKLHTLKAEIRMANNPNPPMQVATAYGFGGRIYGTNNDTVVYLKVIPNGLFSIVQFSIRNRDTPTIYNYRQDTITLPGFSDTFTRSFLVDPRFFVLRG